MKKTLVLTLCLLLVLTALTACGSKISSANAAAANRVLETADDLLDGKINCADALVILSECEDSFQSNGKITDEGTRLKSYCKNISSAAFMMMQTEGQSYSGGTLLARRNELAEYMGVPER